MFSCEYCKIFKNSFLTGHLRWLLLSHESSNFLKTYSLATIKRDYNYFIYHRAAEDLALILTSVTTCSEIKAVTVKYQVVPWKKQSMVGLEPSITNRSSHPEVFFKKVF